MARTLKDTVLTEDGDFVVLHETLYRTDDGDLVVEEDKRARYLYGTRGHRIPRAEAELHGLVEKPKSKARKPEGNK